MRRTGGQRRLAATLSAWMVLHAAASFADDWPMWGYDAARSFGGPTELPETLHLHWTRTLAPPRRA